MFRKIAPWYAKRFGPVNEFNKRIVHITTKSGFEEVLHQYRRWRGQFLDTEGELKPRFRPPPLATSFQPESGTAAPHQIPVPQGPVEVW